MNFFKYLQSVVTTFLNRNKAWVTAVLDTLFVLIALVSIGLVFVKYFLTLNVDHTNYINQLAYKLLYLYVGQEFLRVIFPRSLLNHIKKRWFELFIAMVSLSYLLFPFEFIRGLTSNIKWLGVVDVTFFVLGVTQLGVFIKNISMIFDKVRLVNFLNLTPSQVFIVSFLTPIFTGAALLKLPKATVVDISWVDALFTAASAVCVTGLTVVSTGDDFTILGQIIIACLFQIGGLGIMTLTVAFATILSGRMGVGQNTMMSDVMNIEKIGEVKVLLKRIFLFTITIEAIGALFMYKVSYGYTGPVTFDKVYHSIFHAISAFCNAGFSFHNQSLTQEPMLFNTVVMTLVVLGGLGFPVLSNLLDWIKYKFFGRGKKKIVTLHTKIVLLSTVFLIILGGALIFLFERNHLLVSMSEFEKLFHSFFLSIASRTAGFNTIATDGLNFSTVLVVIILMWIGGAPMSTAGGIKTVTYFVALKNIITNLRGDAQMTLFGRAISQKSIDRSFALITLSFLTIFASYLLIIYFDPTLNKIDLFFETVSAWGTVGLSRGVTPHMSDASKLTVTALMIVGRVGMITFIMSFLTSNKKRRYKYLEENVIMH